MKLRILLFCCCYVLQVASQNQKPEQRSYAGIAINIPADYLVNAENEISNGQYAVVWKDIPEILYQNNVHKQMVKQMEEGLGARFLSAVQFESQGASLTGKLYQLKTKEGIRFRILASGLVNNKPLIVNLGFARWPRKNADLDNFIQQFIRFKE